MIYGINTAPELFSTDFSDFEQILPASPTAVGSFNITATAGVSVTSGTSLSNQYGVIQINTGTGTTGVLSTSPSIVTLGNGIFDFRTNVQIPVLSGTANTFTIRAGLNSATDGTVGVNAVLFEYSSATNGGAWLAKTSSGTVVTQINTGITAGTSWSQLKFIATTAPSNGTSGSTNTGRIDFYVNQVPVGFSLTNIPTTPIAPVISILKSVGTGSTSLYLDYVYRRYEFSTPR